MNIYTGSEPAFTVLLTPLGGVQLEDPLQLGGQAWAGLGNASIFTQSTRVNAIFGDGAGGGLDDRFDIALMSDDIIDGSGPLELVPGSYRPLGNSGTCWNDNITDCSTWQAPFSILRKLYYMSDHLPLAFSLSTNAVLGISAGSTRGATGMALQGRGMGAARTPRMVNSPSSTHWDKCSWKRPLARAGAAWNCRGTFTVSASPG